MAILIIAEHDNSSIKPALLNTVAAAQKIGGDIDILVAGHQCTGAAKAAAAIPGVKKVLVADAAHYAHALAESLCTLIVSIAKSYSHVLASSTSAGKNVLPRVAALLDVAQISDIIKVESADTFVRPIYAGNALATVHSGDAIKVITVRSTGFDAGPATGGCAAIESIAAQADSGLSSMIGQELTKSERPELTS
ncbi:MAG: electron transfer flavoprotein subunit alpha/FixB family protein, partial [Betaproteobacteria bacterium]